MEMQHTGCSTSKKKEPSHFPRLSRNLHVKAATMTIPIYALMRSNRFMDQGLPQKPIPSAAAIFHRAHPSVHFIYLCVIYT